MSSTIQLAEKPEDILRCHEVMRELRPHVSQERFVAQVQRQQLHHNYKLVFLEMDNQVRAVAGYRISECLAWGRFFYVDDFVCRASDQASGHGSALFDWLVQEARKE